MKSPIVPSARALVLLALLAPAAVVIAATAPGAWVVAPVVGVALLALTAIDGLLAGRLLDRRCLVTAGGRLGSTVGAVRFRARTCIRWWG